MNRAARRAAQRGRSIDLRDVCEHGNWMKTDGTGTPHCPHGCGFNPGDPAAARAAAQRARKRQRRTQAG